MPEPPALDYERAMALDAEELGESGIAAAYANVAATLAEQLPNAWPIDERLDAAIPAYSVVAGGVTYQIYGPGIPAAECWGRATYALFDIVNRQLAGRPVHFYALNGGNDLHGILLTESEAADARKRLRQRSDWPYLPVMEPPGFGWTSAKA